MHKGIQAARTQAATERATEAGKVIVERYGLDPALAAGLAANHKDKGIVLLRRMEGIADLLEALAAWDPETAVPSTSKGKGKK